MNRIIKTLTIIIAVILMVTACRTEKDDPVIEVSEVAVSPGSVSLEIGEEITLSARVSPDNASVKDIAWRSASPSVASVSAGGLVKAISPGTAKITADAGGKQAACEVTVNKPFIAVTSVSIDRKSMVLSLGRTMEIKATVLPADATDPSLSWKSSDVDIVTVSEGKVTAVSEGVAVVSVTAGKESVSCKVTVVPEGPDNTEIWYESWSGKALSLGDPSGCGAEVLSNEYTEGKGRITFSGEITSIPASLFKGDTDIKRMSLPMGITSIGDGAFEGCSTLLHITMQEGVQTIGGNAFKDCFSLRDLVLPSTVTVIGSFVLRNNDLIKLITLPENVEELKSFALYGCTALESITVISDEPFTLGYRALDETGDCPVFVPASSVDKYKTAERWNEYKDRIKPLGQ